MSALFKPLTLRRTTFPNRAWCAPMCQYSSTGGFPTEWHRVHLPTRAVGGAGLVIQEATAVTPEGRISPQDAGIWIDEQALAYLPITDAIRAAGAVPGIQLAHAGRKGSTYAPWLGTGSVPSAEGGWETAGPSAVAFGDFRTPHELTTGELGDLTQAFVDGARRARAAGFEVVELHAAHGYLLHEFLSPLSNQREDAYGGDLGRRMRWPLEVVAAVREQWPAELPLFVRISAVDWVEGGLSLADSVEFAKHLGALGVDLIDVSSGGNSPAQQITVGPGYQVPFARAVREGAGVPVGAVGMITEPAQAEAILTGGDADAVLLARQLLREPYWPLRAAHELGEQGPGARWPVQYERAQRR